MLITVHMPTSFGLAEVSQSGRKWMHHRSCHQFMRKGLVDLLRLGRSSLMRYQAKMGQGCLGWCDNALQPLLSHNSAGCSLKRIGFSAEEAKALVATTQATLQREAEEQAMRAAADQVPTKQVNENETPDPLNISTTQPPSIVDMTQASTTVLSQMLGEETQESSLSQPQGPLPDPAFILSNQLVQRPTPLNTSTIAGRAALAKKRKASTSQKTSSKKTKTTTSRSSKRASQVEEQGHADVV